MSFLAFSHKDDRKLGKIYSTYLTCLDNKLSEFLQTKTNQTNEEWCASEKNEYFNYLKDNFKTEYENIIRLESN